ncbi:hypothetical protein Tco_0729629 [Tanacetum coccineum]|uniref:Uncharacterized protein n=1 Tax=Tanacetum coccineum TaxID=301880 RepID=A0ABQ4YT01_9ASTR
MSTSNNSNQQTLADSGANESPPMLEKGNYIPWESKFRRFLDNKLGDRERMVMNYLLQAIPNDIYNSVDACKNAKEIWERTKRLMFGSEIKYYNDAEGEGVITPSQTTECHEKNYRLKTQNLEKIVFTLKDLGTTCMAEGDYDSMSPCKAIVAADALAEKNELSSKVRALSDDVNLIYATDS